MGGYTKNLQLYKADTLEDGNDTFNINRMLNDNWDKIDEKLKKLPVQNGGLYVNSETTEEDKAEAVEAIKEIGLSANDVGAMRNSVQNLKYADLIQWAEEQTVGCSFNLNPTVTTINTPVTGVWLKGELFYNATNSRTILLGDISTGSMWFNFSSGKGVWRGWKQIFTADGSVPMSGELKYYDGSKTLAYPVPMSNAGFHNSVYRGKYLGTAVTDTQWTAIGNGTFEDLYIGDYWTIGGINYRIAAFDYYYRTGDTSCDTHHVVLVPDVIMYTHVMNDTNITDGAYVGSKMYTEGLTQAKTTINNAFGSAHILNHRQLLCNATANGYESGHAWYDSTVELMTEQNVYGCKIFGNQTNGTGWAYNYTIDKSQYPLFTFRPDMISNRQWFWLRDVASAAYFAVGYSNGFAFADYASYAVGVRPAFSIC